MSTTTFLPQPTSSPHRGGLHQQLTGAAARAWSAFERWHARTSERRALRELPHRLLEDVGLSGRRT